MWLTLCSRGCGGQQPRGNDKPYARKTVHEPLCLYQPRLTLKKLVPPRTPRYFHA